MNCTENLVHTHQIQCKRMRHFSNMEARNISAYERMCCPIQTYFEQFESVRSVDLELRKYRLIFFSNVVLSSLWVKFIS